YTPIATPFGGRCFVKVISLLEAIGGADKDAAKFRGLIPLLFLAGKGDATMDHITALLLANTFHGSIESDERMILMLSLMKGGGGQPDPMMLMLLLSGGLVEGMEGLFGKLGPKKHPDKHHEKHARA